MIVIVYCIFGRTRSVACQRKPNVNRSSLLFVVRCILCFVVFFFFFFCAATLVCFPTRGGGGGPSVLSRPRKKRTETYSVVLFLCRDVWPFPPPAGGGEIWNMDVYVCFFFFFASAHFFSCCCSRVGSGLLYSFPQRRLEKRKKR